MVRFCMDARGRITSAAIQKSTGYPDYDARLVAGVRGWTYRPHTIGATPIPVCSTVSFRFAMR
jgi:TonB family protein